jgi:hypothetical protein
MLRVAIGPQVPLPSWNWVGFDLARELAKYFDVLPFESQIPDCEVLIAVKFLAPQMFGRAKVIYLPIDAFVAPQAIEGAAELLKRCAAVGCHAQPLMGCLQPYADRLFFVEHHAKYLLDVVPAYKERGFVLWIGAFEHLPYLLKWHQQHPLPVPLVILTNVDDPRSRKQGFALAQKLDVPLDLSERHLNGHQLVAWCSRAQRELMKQAKAAVDIKGGPWLGENQWHQQMKPPTKAQQWVLSGIPLAVNRDSHSFDYFHKRGLNLATPDDQQRWLSREYWQETKRFAEKHLGELSLEKIGLQFRDLIRQICDAPAAQ